VAHYKRLILKSLTVKNAMQDKVFFDTNLWVYFFKTPVNNEEKAKREALLELVNSGKYIIVSVQVTNELTNVLFRKTDFSVDQIKLALETVTQIAEIIPLTQTITRNALELKEQYSFSWYDSLIVAAALSADCEVLYSEDMHHNLLVEKQLTIKNPFA